MAASSLQLDVGLTDPALIVGLPAISALPRTLVPGTGGFEALNHLAGKVWCGKSQASDREQGMPPQELQTFSWQKFFSDPTEWWDNRRSKKAKVADNCLDWQLSTWDTGMKRPPDFEWQGQGAFAAHEDDLDVQTCVQLCENGQIIEAVDVLNLLVQRGCRLHNNLFYRVLKRCIANKDLVLGRRIHGLTIKSGYEGDTFLATHLIGLYASHGKLEEATQIFSKVSKPDAYLWATIIFACARHGEASQAIRLYRQMRESTVMPDNRLYVAVLKACASAGDLVAGKEVHSHILASRGKPDMFVQTGLLVMYAKCGSLEDARRVFDRLSNKNVVSWTAMIAGYAQRGMGQKALETYNGMQQEGLSAPDTVTFTCLLQACASVGVGALHTGKQLHTQIQERGLQHHVVLGGSLVNMYAKCGSLVDARRMFDKLSDKNVVTWNAMIAGYTQQEMGQEALILYKHMLQDGLSLPNSVTFTCLLQACASVGVGALYEGKHLHAQIEERGLHDDGPLGCSLVNMYAKCGSIEDARRLFERLPQKNVLTWTAIVAGYAQQGMVQEALSLYNGMQQEGFCSPDTVTFACLLQACAGVGVGALHEGKQLHAQIAGHRLETDSLLGGSLVNMYAKCGSIEDARSVFDRLPYRNAVAWTTMIAGYAQRGMGWEALGIYNRMQQEGICPPDSVTFICLLEACARVGVGALHEGKQLHAQISERRLEFDVVVGGSLVNMYARCGSLDDARRVFDRLPDRNVVTWNGMLAGYAQQGMGQEALSLYHTMQQEGRSPDSVTFICVLQACAIVADQLLGKRLHAEIEERGMQADVILGAALVNMYAKCGSMSDSQQVFESLPDKTIEAWGALICGYARQGDSEVVFDLLDRMGLEGKEPNGITFLGALTVCSHVGLVDKGRKYFEVMTTEYGINPTVEHYTCMMDLLGRAGHLEEALQVAKTMPLSPNSVVWHTLLGACEKWSDAEIGRQAFELAVTLEEKDPAPYVLMCNIYAKAQMWEESREMQARRVTCGAWKMPGQCWWTDKDGAVHTFVVGDKKHPETEAIYTTGEQLIPRITREERYVPQLDLSLWDIPHEEKETVLCGLNGKLAIAYP